MLIALVIVSILLVAALIGGWIIINRLLKVIDQLEISAQENMEIFDVILDRFIEAEIELTNIDIKGSFQADDEIGFTFKAIRDSISELTTYLKQVTDTTDGAEEN